MSWASTTRARQTSSRRWNPCSSTNCTINTQMDAINDEVTGEEYNAPRLTIKAFNSYDFETPKDRGTGTSTSTSTSTNHRSIIIHDLAVLQNTMLPALAHDSIVFDSMPRPDLSNLIRVYADQVEKQIIIAIDKTSNAPPKPNPSCKKPPS